MSNDFEDQLRSALRPVDPGDEFARRVLARIAGDEQAQAPPASRLATLASPARLRRPRLQWLSAALAASLLLAVAGTQLWRERSERAAALEAREQLIEALRVTSEKLDLAYQGVQSQTQSQDEEQAGA